MLDSHVFFFLNLKCSPFETFEHPRSLCLGGYIFNQSRESEETSRVRSVPEPLGRYVVLDDGRKIHVSDRRNESGDAPSSTIIFEACQGETLFEFEQVVKNIMSKSPNGVR
jgi:hypothetical protein